MLNNCNILGSYANGYTKTPTWKQTYVFQLEEPNKGYLLSNMNKSKIKMAWLVLFMICRYSFVKLIWNKANLRDLIAAISLVILLKLDSNHCFLSPYDLEVRWMTSTNNRAPVLGHIKLCALLHSHQWIQTGVAVWKHSLAPNLNQNGLTVNQTWRHKFPVKH